MSKPLIGITPSPSTDALPHGTFQRYVLNTAYANAITAAGGIPLILPYSTTDVSALVERLDGLLLSGGADIDPTRYGSATIHPTTYDISPARDAFEFALLREAISVDLPTLCICRGVQVLNVACGGTLYQDIGSETSSDVEHRQQAARISAEDPGHLVRLTPDSKLAIAVAATSLPVNSFHHQAIRKLAPGLAAIGIAPDDLIEAVTVPSRSFVLGVQWHPELMFHIAPDQLVPFLLLVEATMARQPLAAISAH